MLQIEGVVRVLPSTVQTESGELRAEEGNPQPAVIQTFQTLSGPVQVVFPTQAVDTLIEGLKQAKEEAEQKTPPPPATDLVIPGSDLEVEQIKQAHDALRKENLT